MQKNHIDLSDVEKCRLKENTVLQLVFPEQGLVHVRVYNIDQVPYYYTNLTTVPALSTDVTAAQRLGIPSLNITNAIEVDYDLHLYQLFYGVSPGLMRVRVGYPVDTLTRNLDVRQNQIQGSFGFVDGYRSSVNRPSRITETIIPPGIDVGFVFENIENVPVKPLLHWHLVTARIGIIRNAELIYNIMANKLPPNYVIRKTVGGLQTYRYYPSEYWGLNYVDFDVMDMVDIAETTHNPNMKSKAIKLIQDSLGYGSKDLIDRTQKGINVPTY